MGEETEAAITLNAVGLNLQWSLSNMGEETPLARVGARREGTRLQWSLSNMGEETARCSACWHDCDRLQWSLSNMGEESW